MFLVSSRGPLDRKLYDAYRYKVIKNQIDGIVAIDNQKNLQQIIGLIEMINYYIGFWNWCDDFMDPLKALTKVMSK